MFNMRQAIHANRHAAMVLALLLFAGLTAPFLILQSSHAFAAMAPPCTEGNNNGCTELSATPPEDLQSVPPNIVLMLDDSGSMAWDYMPDWTYLKYTSLNGVRSKSNNSLYYDPTKTYTPPPKADSTDLLPDLYPNSPGLTNAYKDGFSNPAATDVTKYTGALGLYGTNLQTTPTLVGDRVVGCPGGYVYNGVTGMCDYVVPPPRAKVYTCLAGDGSPDGVHMCTPAHGEDPPKYPATYACPGGFPTWDGLLCHALPHPSVLPSLACAVGTYVNPPGHCYTFASRYAFTYATGAGPAFVLHYIAPAGVCAILNVPAQKAACVDETDVSGTHAPLGVQAGQNVANWFSYYRTRMLMSKSGLMQAFIKVDPLYRFGFASMNANGVIPGSPTPFAFDDSMVSGMGGSNSNQLAVVQPFGDGTPGTQKAQFWTWLAGVSAANQTPLRKALNAVGQYYQTADPWKTLPGDPGWTSGSVAQFTCRSSYTILTTDGFWNGDDPASIGNAAATDGPVNTVPAGNATQYLAVPPFSGPGGAVGGSSPSLADVATYYWETDLNTDFDNDVPASKSDPASWQHMTTFTIGLGFTPVGITPVGATVPQIFGWAAGGAPIPLFSWPTPAVNSQYNIADLAHAAVNGHGDFFNVTDPSLLAAAFSQALADIGARTVPPRPVSLNSSVLSLGAVTFLSGYTTADWSGQFQAAALQTDGTVGQILWKADDKVNGAYHSNSLYVNRTVFTSAYKAGVLSAFQFTAANQALLDPVETAGMKTPPLGSPFDTFAARINYLLGDNTNEGTYYRARTSILGAIIHSDPTYVAGASGGYSNTWPTIGGFAPPESSTGAQPYTSFVSAEATRAPRVYVGANDGMMHAFNAPVPYCSGTVDASGNCSNYAFMAGLHEGEEAWAFIPRAVYANLGNLTTLSNFHYRPTVDGSPVTRDVFFSDLKWHTILTGGAGLGGRGVYALDITDPGTAFSASNVLWELDSDMTVDPGCTSIQGTSADIIGCRGTDLGYSVPQPNVGRLANGKWVTLVSNGYFPDCTTPDAPTKDVASCQAVAAQAPQDASGNPYSALFVLDAQTGKAIAELKTPVIAGVTSFGLARAVLGDYNSDQVDDVAFAGDAQGNLWRFDLSDPHPANWTVSLVYQGLTPVQGLQPITTMPRLFPDPATNRFLVVFGTGKYLGVGDNSSSQTQTVYAVRDTVGTSYSQTDLVQQYLHEIVVTGDPHRPDGTYRCVSGGASDTCSAPTPLNPVSSTAGGWFINLYTASGGPQTDVGERVVVNPAAIFASNTVVFESLITGAASSNACSPSLQGALLALDVPTGGPTGMSSLGGYPIAGARIQGAHTSGSLPIVSALGGGTAYVLGATIGGGGASQGPPVSVDAPIWRRRSWQVLMNDQ
ncbi:MAG: PilC/PilY family type IV pilus protein [Rhodanobacter sp.]